MTNTHRRPFDLARGFTLVELLVVIAIIGVLATLLLLQLNVARSKARDARRVTDINQVRSALELYFDDNGKYPETNVGLNTLLANYLSKVPDDPLRACTAGTYDGAGGCYGYAWDPATNPTRFHVWAELEQDAKSALGGDFDFNSTAWARGGFVNGGSEACTSSSAVDCVYDTGQTQ